MTSKRRLDSFWPGGLLPSKDSHICSQLSTLLWFLHPQGNSFYFSSTEKQISAASPLCPSLVHPGSWSQAKQGFLPCPHYMGARVRRGCSFFYCRGSSHHRVNVFVPQTSLRPQHTQAEAPRGRDISPPTLSHATPQLVSRDHLSQTQPWIKVSSGRRKEALSPLQLPGTTKGFQLCGSTQPLSSSGLSLRNSCLHNLSPLAPMGERGH